MWLFGSEPDALGQGATADDSDRPSDVTRLGRYRSYGRFYERYWTKLFGVTQADITRLVDHMKVSETAPTLTELAQNVIAARLLQGPQLQSGPALTAPSTDSVGKARSSVIEVRRWDPTHVWHAGDRVIVAAAVRASGRTYAPHLGEIAAVHEDRVVAYIDGSRAPEVFPLGADAITERDAAAEKEMAALAEQRDEASQIDFVLWAYGQYVVSRLLDALAADDRFVELEGRWSLRDLTTRPSNAALDQLARVMFEGARGPLTMSETMMLLPGSDGGGYSGRLGLALALQDRTDLFRNVGTGTYPRWTLAGPPPGVWTAHRAAYDPDTYAILCMPGERISRAVAQRLWDLDLLRAVTAPASDRTVGAEAQAASDGAPRASLRQEAKLRPSDRPRADHPLGNGTASRRRRDDAASGRGWPKWLRFSRQ